MSGSLLAVLEGCEVRRRVEPPTSEDLAREIARARAEGMSVLPLGEGSRLAAGRPPARVDLALVTTRLGRILHYEPADLTVTVEGGCTLAALQSALRERGQFLPLQPARGRGTVGGLIAAAPEGALTLGYGRVRDRLLGLRAALADGTIAKGGGRVVKNVAGYPLHRLIAGSFGTLGVVVEASFKIQPLPEAQGARTFAFPSESAAFEAARLALASGTEPVFVDVLTDGSAAHVAVGYDGSRARVEAHLARAADLLAPARPAGSRVLSPEADAELRRALDDPEHLERAFAVCAPGVERSAAADTREDAGLHSNAAIPPGQPDECEPGTGIRCIVRVMTHAARLEETLASSRTAAIAAGATVLGAARPGLGSAHVLLVATDEALAARATGAFLEAARAAGCAVVLSAPASVRGLVDPWGVSPPDFFLMKRIKDALDPDGVFVAGRFVGGL